MKAFSLFSLAVLLLFACHSAQQETKTEVVETTDSTIFKNLINVYTAKDFGNGPIYINLNFFNGKDVGGYNVHNGLRRNIHGTAKKENGNWVVTLSEPGDHPLDGVFTLTFNAGFTSCDGKWIANNAKYAEKTFKLEKADIGADDSNFGGATFDLTFVDYAASKSEIHFNKDGTCELKLYKKITDSTYAEQLVALAGSYQKENDSILKITWKPNDIFPQQSFFTMELDNSEGDKYIFPRGIHGEDYRFLPVF